MKRHIVLLLMMILICNSSTDVFGWGDHNHFRDGRYYTSVGWWGIGGFVTGLTVGTYISTLPSRYETIVVSGVPYYYADGYYYQAGPNGYVVVSPPVIQGQIVGPSSNIMVYIIGVLLGILLLVGIGFLLKKLFT